MLTDTDIAELVAFRHQLHRHPELSGQELATAAAIASALQALSPARILTGLGGHGVAAVFDSGEEGPTVLFRAELDALPIVENSNVAWASLVPGCAHLCGHDGHMTMLLAFGRMLHRQPVAGGRIVLMFQPAEEDGSGARAVVADPRFEDIDPDWAFSIHNEPGLAFGYVGTREGLINCASRGLAIRIAGRTSHAAEPELALSPVGLIGDIVNHLESLGRGGALDDSFRLATVTHVRVGKPSFGITPGDAEILVTLRASTDGGVDAMEMAARQEIDQLVRRQGLQVAFSAHDDFAASINHREAVAVATRALDELGIPHGSEGVPMRASEDFGVFGWGAKSAMLCLGAGPDHPALHQPDYDFPDDLIPIGAGIFATIARDLCTSES
ncbi:MAG: amidohydrolase [Candidatus Puniceispirillaceae bacterium]